MKLSRPRWRIVVRALLLVTLGLLARPVIEFGIRRPYTAAIAVKGAPSPIAALERIPVRGVEQSVLIRGHDQTKPILLFLHGGPGMPVMFMAHDFQEELERDFLVVHWDRGGAGKSYEAFSEESASVRSTLDDLYDLTIHLRGRFKTDQIYLVGHSWGTYLGMLAAHERPELFKAFVGTGQMSADPARIRAARHEFFSREAAVRGDHAMLKRLKEGDRITEDDLFAYGAELRGEESYWPILMLGLRAPEYTLSDVMNVPKGSERLAAAMKYDVMEGPLDRNLLRFEIPIHFFLGRHDWNEPSTLAEEYLRRIEAPAKSLVWFEQSAHFPFLEEPERFGASIAAVAAPNSTRK